MTANLDISIGTTLIFDHRSIPAPILRANERTKVIVGQHSQSGMHCFVCFFRIPITPTSGRFPSITSTLKSFDFRRKLSNYSWSICKLGSNNRSSSVSLSTLENLRRECCERRMAVTLILFLRTSTPSASTTSTMRCKITENSHLGSSVWLTLAFVRVLQRRRL